MFVGIIRIIIIIIIIIVLNGQKFATLRVVSRGPRWYKWVCCASRDSWITGWFCDPRARNRWQRSARRDVTPKRYRYVTRATATTKCRVGQECSSTQGLYRLCGHPHRNPLGSSRRRRPPQCGRRRVCEGGPPSGVRQVDRTPRTRTRTSERIAQL